MKPNDDLIIIDRIEGNSAIAQKGEEIFEIALEQIGFDISEGDILRKTTEGYEKDDTLRTERQKSLFEKQQNLFKRK